MEREDSNQFNSLGDESSVQEEGFLDSEDNKITARELHLKNREKMNTEDQDKYSKEMGNRSRSMTMLERHGAKVEDGRFVVTEKQIENAEKLMKKEIRKRVKEALKTVLEIFDDEHKILSDSEKIDEIKQKWDHIYDRVYSEESSKNALDKFKKEYVGVRKLELPEKFEKLGIKIFEGQNPKIKNDKRDTVLFTEMTCGGCKAKKFFETDNDNDHESFNLQFSNNGNVNKFTEGVLELAESKKGIDCAYCKMRKHKK